MCESVPGAWPCIEARIKDKEKNGHSKPISNY